MQSVYDALAETESFNPLIITFPHKQAPSSPAVLKEGENENFEFFNKQGMKVISGYNADGSYIDLKQLNVDIVFYEQPHQLLPKELWVGEVRRYALTCYVGYGFMIAKIQQLQFNRVFHHQMWRIFCETEMHKELFARYSEIGDHNVVITGYPKLDVYLHEIRQDSDKIWKISKKENPHIKRVIWAPHFSIKNREVAFSTFHKYYRFFLELAKKTPGIDWIIKPHPWLRLACVKYGLMSEEGIDGYFAQWETLPNAQVYEQGDYFNIFRTSDAIVMDCVSFIAEYLPTENPMLFLINKEPPLVGFNEVGEKLNAGMYRAYCEQEIEVFICKTVLQDDDPLKEKRQDLVRNVICLQPEGAGIAVKNHLEQQFCDVL